MNLIILANNIMANNARSRDENSSGCIYKLTKVVFFIYQPVTLIYMFS